MPPIVCIITKNQLILDGYNSGEILIDQGDQDDFLKEQLKPETFAAACQKMN